METVILIETRFPTLRTELWDEEANDYWVDSDLDPSKAKREYALIRLAAYQNELKKYYNSQVKAREFNLGHRVLGKVTLNTKEASEEKLGTQWEGPYKVIEVDEWGAYRLKNIKS